MKNIIKLKRHLLIILVLLMLPITALSAFAASKIYFVKPDSNLYKKASISSEVILIIKKKTEVEPISKTKDNKFYKIKLDDDVGYILKSDLDIKTATDKVASAKSSKSTKAIPSKKAKTNDSISDNHGTVYVTKTGAKYHSKSCRTIAKSKGLTITTVEKAEGKGFEPCKVCK